MEVTLNYESLEALAISEPWKFGYTPDALQAEYAVEHGFTSDVESLATHLTPWDAGQDKPQLVAWKDFEKTLDEDYRFNWWEVECDNKPAEAYFVRSQGNLGSCASFGFGMGGRQTTLLVQIAAKSYQGIARVNPLPTFLKSKGGSRSGGQTMARMAQEFLDTGCYLASQLGEYNASGAYDKQKIAEYAASAGLRQMGFCEVPGVGDILAENIAQCLRSNKSVAIGNTVGVADGTTKDANGVEIVRLGGSWSHATCFAGWKEVNSTEYFLWINSHGDIYKSNDGTPAFCGWMTYEQLIRFVSGRWTDAYCVHYVEEPYDINQQVRFDR